MVIPSSNLLSKIPQLLSLAVSAGRVTKVVADMVSFSFFSIDEATTKFNDTGGLI